MSRDPSKLRSNFEEGTSRWAVRRAQWRALGLTDEDMAKPKIAVINTSSEIAICFSHLDGVAAEIKKAVENIEQNPVRGAREQRAGVTPHEAA